MSEREVVAKGREKRKLTHSPSPSACGLVGSTKDRLSDVSTDPDVDDTRNRGEDRPEKTVAKGRNIGDDDVLKQEETSNTETMQES